MIKGSLGAAVLSMHEAYMIGGLWTSLAVTIVVGVLVAYTMFVSFQHPNYDQKLNNFEV